MSFPSRKMVLGVGYFLNKFNHNMIPILLIHKEQKLKEQDRYPNIVGNLDQMPLVSESTLTHTV